MNDQEWSCGRCGYVMDQVEGVDDPSACPCEGDITMCLNCGATYSRRKSQWIALTDSDVAQLPDEIGFQLRRVQEVRKKVITEDLPLNRGMGT